jgi:hypothetical protein
VIYSSKEKEEQNSQTMIKTHVPKIKEIMKSPSSFRFENEIQKIKIPVPFLDLIKNEEFKNIFPRCYNPNLPPIPLTQ